jgi:hypothetical protein
MNSFCRIHVGKRSVTANHDNVPEMGLQEDW